MAGEKIRRLRSLLGENFLVTCQCPNPSKRSWYCIDCSSGHCSGCLKNHRRHRLAQIRRYKKDHKVVRVDVLETMISCASIQWHTLGSDLVVLLYKSEAQPRLRRPRAHCNNCLSCRCPLPAPKSHCSLSCKVDDLARIGLESLSGTSGIADEASSSAGG